MTTTPTIAQMITMDDPAALADLVIESGGHNLPIVDYGVAHRGVGNPPPAEHVKLSQATPGAGIIEHYERDLTVRAAAGATLGTLRGALKPSGQFIPIDADDDLTLGEVIHHHVYGGLRAGYPGIRDLLLGLRYLDGEGRQIHVGGRTVKNVAGYDLTRFMVGGLGEFGLVYEATLRTYAIPEHALVADIRFDDPAVMDRLLPGWLLSDASPAILTLDNHTGPWVARVGFFGGATGCAVQLRSLETLLDRESGVYIDGSGESPVEAAMRQIMLRRAWRRTAGTLAKIVVPPAATGAVCQALASSSTDPPSLAVAAHPVHGCIYVGGDLGPQRTLALSQTIDSLIARHGGFRVWHARPRGCEHLPPFAPAQPDWPMIFRLKRTMDPRNLFNPGRFVPPIAAAISGPPA